MTLCESVADIKTRLLAMESAWAVCLQGPSNTSMGMVDTRMKELHTALKNALEAHGEDCGMTPSEVVLYAGTPKS